jgi:hypothetical protein
MGKILLVLLSALLCGCSYKKSKKKLFNTKKVCAVLCREKFIVYSGGAYSAELYSDYLTDYTNFKVYVGTHDEHENFDYECLGDTVFVKKFTFGEDTVSTILLKLKFSISDLKKKHEFE